MWHQRLGLRLMPQSLQQLPKPISVLRPPLVAAGGLFSLISFITLIWAFYAKVPEQVYGTAALVQVDSNYEVKSLIPGTVVYPIVPNGDSFEYRKDLWGRGFFDFVKSPSLFSDDQILATAKFLTSQTKSDLTSMGSNLYEFSSGFDFGGANRVSVQKGDVLARIENPVMERSLKESVILLGSLSAKYQDLLSSKRKLLTEQIKLGQSKGSMVGPVQALQKNGYVSKVEALNIESEAQNQKVAIETTQSSIDELELKIEEAKSNLRKELYSYVQQSFLFAIDKGVIESFRVPQWANITQNQTIFELGCGCNEAEYVIPIAVDQINASRIAPGMNAIFTPVGLNSSEVGGIQGQIIALDSEPVEVATLAARLSSPGLASMLEEQHQVAYIAYAKLELSAEDNKKLKAFQDQSNKPSNRGIFKWNNRSNPPVKPHDGILLSVQITTRNRSPVEMIMPNINEFLGRTTPYELIKKERG